VASAFDQPGAGGIATLASRRDWDLSQGYFRKGKTDEQTCPSMSCRTMLMLSLPIPMGDKNWNILELWQAGSILFHSFGFGRSRLASVWAETIELQGYPTLPNTLTNAHLLLLHAFADTFSLKHVLQNDSLCAHALTKMSPCWNWADPGHVIAMNVAVSEEQDWFSVHRWDAEGATWTYLVVEAKETKEAKEAKEDEENEQHRNKAGKITVCPEFCISKEFSEILWDGSRFCQNLKIHHLDLLPVLCSPDMFGLWLFPTP